MLLFCYHYDPATGSYGATVLTIVRAGAIATVLAFAIFLTVSLRRDHAVAMAVTTGAGPVSPGHRT